MKLKLSEAAFIVTKTSIFFFTHLSTPTTKVPKQKNGSNNESFAPPRHNI